MAHSRPCIPYQFIFLALISLNSFPHCLLASPTNVDSDGFAIHGYDPVSYVSGNPESGYSQFECSFNGVKYRFINESNKLLFMKSPEIYTPAYGGYCAWAMLEGEKVDINPRRFKIIEGKTYLYYDGFWGDTLKKWNTLSATQPESQLVQKADQHWEKLLKKSSEN